MSHVDLDPDNALRYQAASQKSNRSIAKIVNAVLRSVSEVLITEIVEVKTKPDPDLPSTHGKKKPIRHTSAWKITL